MVTEDPVPFAILAHLRHCERSVKVRDLLRLLHEDGWYLAETRGSHHQFKHPVKPGRVTVAGHRHDDIAVGTLKSVLRQAGLSNPQSE
ncbi:MAG: type II toxin-antitoxin system HicA family toxin [Gemmatimonadaceae bacterium]